MPDPPAEEGSRALVPRAGEGIPPGLRELVAKARRRKLERAETHVSWMRVAVAAIIWLALPLLVGRAGTSGTALVGIVTLGTAYTGLAHLAHRRSWLGIETRARTTAVVDAAFILAMIHVSGGWFSALTPLLFVSMAGVAHRFALSRSLGFGVVYAAAYVGLMVAQAGPLTAPVDLTLRAAFLVATGTLASLNSEAHLDAVRERARSEHTYQRILETVPSTVSVVDRDGVIRYVNQSRRGVDADEIVGTSLADWFAGESLQRVRSALERVFEEGGTTEYEVFGEASDGRAAYYRSLAAPLPGNGDVTAAVVVSVDITRRVRAERRLKDQTRALRQSNEALARYASLTAHDLREPLRDVVRFLQRVDQREDDLSAESRREMNFVIERAHRLDDLVGALHSFAEVDDRPLHLEEVRLDEAVEEALVRLDVSGPPGMEVRTENLPEVTADRAALVQILEHLIENAHQHAEGDVVRIRVDARQTDDGWQVSVEDDGPGIHPRYQERIFEPFERLQASPPRGQPGMGLATVRRLLERLGGEIHVESNPGDGARFTFTLPERPVLADTDADAIPGIQPLGG